MTLIPSAVASAPGSHAWRRVRTSLRCTPPLSDRRIYFSCLVLEFTFASCNKRPFHFNIIKFELPGFQSGRVPFLFVPYFVLRFCTGTETSVGGCTSQKCDTKLTRLARKRGGREGPPQGRPNTWVGRPLVKPTRLHPAPDRWFASPKP